MIISASRRTDIPAFFSDWFINCLNQGRVMVRNPWKRNLVYKINLNPSVVDCIVFWTKNPRKLLERLEVLDNLGYHYYFLFTLNAYDQILEQDVPPQAELIETFLKLSQRIGSRRVVWRYDPIVITDQLDFDYHYRHFEYLACRLYGYTHRCIISFLDLYKKCRRNLQHLKVIEPGDQEMRDIAAMLKKAADNYKIELQTCAEKIDFSDVGIPHGKCIDDQLIQQIIGEEVEVFKDKHQRALCRCVESVDIGAYNTCRHHCRYCYANFSRTAVKNNLKRHHPLSPMMLGEVSRDDSVIEIEQESIIMKQGNLFGTNTVKRLLFI